MRSARLFAVTVLAVVLALSAAQNAFAVTELAYDDNSNETVGGVHNGIWAAVKFVLSDFGLNGASYKLQQVRFFVYVAAVGITGCTSELHIFDGTGVNGLLTMPVASSSLPTSLDWFTVDLSGENVVVSGSFYVAIRTNLNPNCPELWFGEDVIPNNLNPPSPARTHTSLPADTPVWGIAIPGLNFMFRSYVNPAAPVGGIVASVDTFSVLAPWLAVIGLVGCVTAVAVVAKKRQ